MPEIKPAGGNPKPKEFLGIHFRCCNVYGRIYKNKAGSAYAGNCPRCGKRVEAKVGSNGNGTDQRFFHTS